MWKIKHFKTSHDQANWIGANDYRYQITVLFVNNGYAVQYRKLMRVY